MKRSVVASAGVSVGAISSAIALVLGAGAGNAEEAANVSSAYGVAAGGDIAIDPTPYVESVDESDQSTELANVQLGGFGSISAASLSAGAYSASAELAGVSIGDGANEIQIGSIVATCENGIGGASIAEFEINGEAITVPESLPPNTDITYADDPDVTIIANRQVETSDGGFTVEALYFGSDELGQDLTVASASCSAEEEPEEEPEEEKEEEKEAPRATRPTPIETQLPVTS